MAKARVPSEYRIPSFKEENMYVYFNSLNTNNHPPNITALTKKLYGTANAYFNTNAFNLIQKNNTSKTIETALSFLGRVAENERNKEIRLIENYIKEIENQIPKKLLQGREMQEILNNLKTTSKTLSLSSKDGGIDPKQLQGVLDNFYTELTTYINLVKQSVDELQERVQQLLDDSKTTREALTARSYLYRVDGDIETALKESVGAAAKKTADSFSSMISETIMDHLADMLIDNIDLQKNFHAILSGMIVDFEHFLQQDKASKGFMILDNNYDRDGIRNMFEKYLTDSDTYFSNEMRKTTQLGSLSNGFKLALDNFSSRIGLSFFDDDTEEAQARIEAKNKYYDNITKIAIKGQRNYIAKKLYQMNLGNLVEKNQLIKITPKTDQRHGTMFEAIQTILYGAMSTEGHPATDTVGMGSLLVQIDNQGIQDLVTEQLGQIADEVRKTGNQIRKNRKDSTVEALQEANQKIKKQAHEINDMINPLLKQKHKDLFIYHESLKLYSYMEQSDGSGEELKRKTKQFEGRDLNALNLIDLLYSMDDGTNQMGLLNQTALKGAMLNLSKFAVGGQKKATVSEYLSIFTGMIMFSDITNMATEIGQMASNAVIGNNNDAFHVHLYNLNGTYVPGSMLLTYIHKILTELGTNMDISQFATAHINTAGADKAIDQYEKERTSGKRKHMRKDWEEMAEKVQQGTKVKITFMGTFLNLIDQIGSIF